MQTISRRQFLIGSTMGVAAAGSLSVGALRLKADPLGLPIGFQIYPVREQAAKDFEGTLRQLAALGYRGIELCSFRGYANAGFAPLQNMKAPEARRIMNAAGLRCESSHFTAQELQAGLEESIAWAKEIGLKYMIASSAAVSRDTGTLEDWRRAADDFNKMAEQTKKAGIQFGYHNHNHEFKELNGVLIYDEFMSRLDPKLVAMQLQVAIISAGYDPVEVLNKYPGRFCSLHLADWSPADKKSVPVGQGAIDWKRLFAAAKRGGVKNYFVEMNMEALKASYPYLHDLKV